LIIINKAAGIKIICVGYPFGLQCLVHAAAQYSTSHSVSKKKVSCDSGMVKQCELE
jgi:hypothetical protein